MTDWDDNGAGVGELGEDIIELTDIVSDAPDSGTDNGIIELVDIVKDEETDLNLDIIKVEPVGEIEDFDEGFDEGFELEGNKTFSRDTGSEDEGLLKFPTLTSEQFEAALEKVIEKQFADKIQTILFQVMEKVMEREIAGIRESLQKDLDQIGNA